MKKISLSLATVTLLSVSVVTAQDINLDGSGWHLVGISDSLVDGSSVKMVDAIKDISKIDYIIGQDDGMFKAEYLTKYDSYKSKIFKPSKGYWIKVKDDESSANISFAGKTVPFDISSLNTGWNLVGFDKNAKMSSIVEDLSSKGFKAEYIIGQDDGMFKAEYLTKYASYKSKTFTSGKGYWLKMLQALDTQKIGDTDFKLIAYTDKDLTDSNKKDLKVIIDSQEVTFSIPSDATKLTIRVENPYGVEVYDDVISDFSSDVTLSNVSLDVTGGENPTNLNTAFYVVAATASGVPYPLAGVEVYSITDGVQSTDPVGTTDGEGRFVATGIATGTNLYFDIDGYAGSVVKYTGKTAVDYVTLNVAEEKMLDGGYEDDNATDPTMARMLFDKYSESLKIDGQSVGTFYMNKFSPNSSLSGVRLNWSAISDFSSFDGLNIPLDTDGNKLTDKVTTGAETTVRKIVSAISLQAYKGTNSKSRYMGDETLFSNLDANGEVTSYVYLTNFAKGINPAELLASGADIILYAFDGKKWTQVADADIELEPIASMKDTINNSDWRADKALLRKVKDADYYIRIKNLKGIRTLVAITEFKEANLNSYNFDVVVTEADNSPIANAKVVVAGNSYLTGADGKAKVEFSLPKATSNIPVSISAPNHYSFGETISTKDASVEGYTYVTTLQIPPQSAKLYVNVHDEDSNAVAYSNVDIITPAVLSDIRLEDGAIIVGDEPGAVYEWYVKAHDATNSPLKRAMKRVNNTRTLARVGDTNATWETLTSNTTNKVTFKELYDKIIKADGYVAGQVDIGVVVKHQNGLIDQITKGSEHYPVHISTLDLTFNKDLLTSTGGNAFFDAMSIHEDYDLESTLLGDVGSQYFDATTASAKADTMNVKWYGVLKYANESGDFDAESYYYDISSKTWKAGSDLNSSLDLNSHDIDTATVLKNLVSSDDKYLILDNRYITFDAIANYMTDPDVVTSLLKTRKDIGADREDEKTIATDGLSLYLIPHITYTNEASDKNVSNWEFGALSWDSDVLKTDGMIEIDYNVHPASILPHHIVARTSVTGDLAITNIPLEFGGDADSKDSYLKIKATKDGYTPSNMRAIPKFSMDDTSTTELEDIANVSLKVINRDEATLAITVKDTNGTVLNGAVITIPTATISNGKYADVIGTTDGTGTLSSTVYAGEYLVSVNAVGHKGKTAQVMVKKGQNTVEVKLDQVQTGVTISRPLFDSFDVSVSDDKLIVQGKITDTASRTFANATTLLAIVNDEAISLELDETTGEFIAQLQLEQGINTVEFIASNSVGKFRTKEYKIEYIGELYTLKGSVKNSADDSAIADAIVKVVDSSGEEYYFSTDSNGNYMADSMPSSDSFSVQAIVFNDDGTVSVSEIKDVLGESFEDGVTTTDLSISLTANDATFDTPATIIVDNIDGVEWVYGYSTDKSYAEISGRLQNFAGVGAGSSVYAEITNASGEVQTVKIASNGEDGVYSYKATIPLGYGANSITIVATNPPTAKMPEGSMSTYPVFVERTKPVSTATNVDGVILLTDLFGKSVDNATVTAKTLKGDLITISNSFDINETTYNGNSVDVSLATIEGKLPVGKFVNFEVVADGYEKNSKIFKVDTNGSKNFFWFVMKNNKTYVDDNQTEVQEPEETIATNEAPVIEELYTYPSVDIMQGENLYVESSVFDPEGDALNISWKVDGSIVPNENYQSFIYPIPTNAPAGEHNLTMVVSDGNKTVTETVSINVIADSNVAPVLTITESNATVSLTESEYTISYSTYDSDASDIVNVGGISSNPAVATVESEAQTAGEIIVSIHGVGTAEIILKAYDGKDFSTKQVFTITVYDSYADNTPPVITQIDDVNLTVNEYTTHQVQASDVDVDNLTYSATNAPSGLSIDSDTGLISGTPDTIGTYVTTITVSDGESTDSTTFTVNVISSSNSTDNNDSLLPPQTPDLNDSEDDNVSTPPENDESGLETPPSPGSN